MYGMITNMATAIRLYA